MTLVRLEPATLRSRVKHSTTEPLRSQIFIKLHLNVPLCEFVYRTDDSAMQTQRQGHTSRSWNSAAGDLAVLQTVLLCLGLLYFQPYEQAKDSGHSVSQSQFLVNLLIWDFPSSMMTIFIAIAARTLHGIEIL